MSGKIEKYEDVMIKCTASTYRAQSMEMNNESIVVRLSRSDTLDLDNYYVHPLLDPKRRAFPSLHITSG